MNNNERKKRLNEDGFLVDTFKGLVVLALSFLSLILLIILPTTLVVLAVARLIQGEWIVGVICLALSAISHYTGRGLTELLKEYQE